MAPALIFCLSLLLCLFHTFGQGGGRNAFLFDGGHYLGSVEAVSKSLAAIASGASPPDPRLVPYLMLDGPVVPLLSALILKLAGLDSGAAGQAVLLAAQAVLQSLAAVLVAFLAGRALRSRQWGFAAGLVWAFYPAAVAGQGLFLGETLAALLLLLLVLAGQLALAAGRRWFLWACLAGLLAGLILLSKPALFPGCIGVCLLACIYSPGWRSRLVVLLCFLAGLALTVSPWAAFTGAATGTVSLSPQRVPVLNASMGTNLESDGFGSNPQSLNTTLFQESEGVPAVLAARWSTEAGALCNLTLRKIARLWATPWNDFRSRFLFLPVAAQVWWHQALLVAGAAGMALALAMAIKPETAPGLPLTASVLIVLSHLIYTQFEAIPRYGFTAMPFICILAVSALHTLVKARDCRRLSACLAAAGLVTVCACNADLTGQLVVLAGGFERARWTACLIRLLALLALSANIWALVSTVVAGRRQQAGALLALSLVFALPAAILIAAAADRQSGREWAWRLKAADKAVREIAVSAGNGLESGQPDWAVVIIDGDGMLGQARVAVNGRLLRGSPSSIYDYDTASYMQLNGIQLFAGALRVRPEDMRQWRAIAVPVSFINLNGPNRIEVSPGATGRCTIYGDYPAGGRERILSSRFFAAGRIWCSASSLESRLLEPQSRRPGAGRSLRLSPAGIDQEDLSAAAGRQNGGYRIHLVLGYRQGRMPGGAARADGQPAGTFSATLAASAFAKGKGASETGAVLIESGAGRVYRTSVRLPARFASGRAGSHLAVSLTGSMRGMSGVSVVTVVAIATGAAGAAPVVLPPTPVSLAAKPSGTPVEVSGLIPVSAVAGGVEGITVELYPAHGGAQLSDLSLTVAPASLPSFAGHWLRVL